MEIHATGWVYILLLAFLHLVQGDAQICYKNCASCASYLECISCKDGYYKGKQYSWSTYSYSHCMHQCRDTCQSCTAYDECISCNDGYYKGKQFSWSTYSYSFCWHRCRDTCKSCTSYDTCIKCNSFYHGQNCTYACPLNCLSCTSMTRCTACKVGYYNIYLNDTCPGTCPTNCLSCTSINRCTACKDGYYSVNKIDTCTGNCQTNCKSCTSYNNCTECYPGFYGSDCSLSCSSNCINKICDKITGTCKTCPKTCTSCTSSLSCTSCVDGYYSSTYPQYSDCSKSCRPNCKSCYSYNNCKQCKPYYHDTHCNNTCLGCFDGKCDIASGVCKAGCKLGFAGVYEFYGDKCDCPMNCYCEQYSNYCSSCKQGFINTYKKCECRTDMCTTTKDDTSCKNNTWYLDIHSQSCCQCSANCKHRECKSSTECTLGCVDGFYGQSCDKTCSSQDKNCLKCLEQNEHITSCLECKIGMFPDNKTQRCIKCSENCLNRKCSTTGLCVCGCKIGYWGELCQNTCKQNCSKCNRYNGSCEVCSDGKYSLDCSLSCNDGCNQSDGKTVCKITDGTCLYGCLSSKMYGKTCLLNCSENCLDRNCDWETGHCSNGCVNNFYATKCDKKCSDHCLSINETLSRCHNRNGSCLLGCKTGYFGDNCKDVCSTNCKNTTCKQSSGECLFGCNDGFTESTCVHVLTAKAGDSMNGAVVGGTVGGVLFIMLVAALFIVVLCVVRTRRNSRPPRLGDKPQYENASYVNQNNALLNDPGPIYNNTSESERLHMSKLSVILTVEVEEEDEPGFGPPPISNAAADKTYYNVVRRVHVDELAEYVAKKQPEDFEEEFQEFKHGLVEGISYADSQKRANVEKNRYRFIYPYDEHRVRLTGKGTDYINASYLDGFHKQNTYIACLGPTEKTTDTFVNFWRMVWQTKVEKVVMVTNLFENGDNKCDQYWPNAEKSVTYGDVTVTYHTEDVYADYTVRNFSISSMSEIRTLNHFHYTAWPDKGVPDDVMSLIEFRHKVIITPTSLDGPIIVHCSAGVGSTGTYIALDILTTEGEHQKTVDIFGCVEHMREHRVNMVQTAKQYEYLHNALVHTLTDDSRAIPVDKFQEYYSSISDSDIMKKYEQLQNSKEEKDRNETMKQSNRTNSDVPGDLHRPKLSLLKTRGSSDYINAVYINSFKTKNRFLLAQTPLPATALDFISLIYRTNCSCIVSMEPIECLKNKTGTYFPADNQELNIGPFKILSAEIESALQCIQRKLTIVQHGQSRNNERTIHHYQYTQWQSGKLVPDSAAGLLQMVRDIDKKAHESDEKGPIIIHCLNGGEKSGIFCVVTMLIEKMEIEHEVSIVNCVRMVKSKRETAIPNKEQYSFCYQCVNAYLQWFHNLTSH